MSSHIGIAEKTPSACKIVDIGRWLPHAWLGEIEDGTRSLAEEINSALLSRMVYVLGTVSGSTSSFARMSSCLKRGLRGSAYLFLGLAITSLMFTG
jgi:hypothetical protein